MPQRRSLLALTLLLLLALVPLSASASYYDSFPIQQGFSHTKLKPDDSGAGLPLAGASGAGSIIRRGSPTIAEIDGNTTNGKEIAVGANDGWLYVYHKNGSLVWRMNVLPGGAGSCSYDSQFDGVINSAPAVGALFGDGVQYAVIGYGTINGPNSTHPSTCPGGVAAYDGRNGTLKWRFTGHGSGESLHGVISSPGLADVNGDGNLEVGYGDLQRNFEMLKSDGSELWYRHNADTVWSSPAFADADGDGLPDMIIGSDISANPRAGTSNGGYVQALRGTNSTYIWRVYFDQTIYSSPAVADLDGDGVKEVIVGSGCYFSPASLGHWVKILDIRDGHTIRTLNAAGCLSSAPALGDIDGDGKLEIVANINGFYVGGPGRVQAWDYDNPTPKWTTTPHDSLGNNDPFIDDIQSPVLADLDGNGSLEVVLANVTDVVVLRGSNGQQLTCNGCITGPGKAMFTLTSVKSTPAVGDLDGDGDLEVVIGGGYPTKADNTGVVGHLFVWTNFAGQLGSSAGPLAHYSAPWPTFHHDPLHTGVLVQPNLRPSVPSLALMVQQGDPAQTISVALKDDAGGAINWSATKDQPWISLNATNGTTPDTLIITIDPGNMGLGTYTGAVSLSSSVNSPKINVTLIVVDQINQVYLPIARR